MPPAAPHLKICFSESRVWIPPAPWPDEQVEAIIAEIIPRFSDEVANRNDCGQELWLFYEDIRAGYKGGLEK